MTLTDSDATATTAPAGEVWELLHELVQQQRWRAMAIAAEFDLSPPQMWALRALEPGRPAAMSDLAGALHCDNSNVTGIIDRLEEHGLVERRAAEHDRRVKHLVVTAEGAKVRERLGEAFTTAPAPIATLSEQDQLALRDILRRALDRA